MGLSRRIEAKKGRKEISCLNLDPPNIKD